MTRFAGTVLALLVATSAACRADTAKQFVTLYNSEDGQGVAIAKVAAMETGLHEANEYLKAHNEKAMYCQPAQLALTGSQVGDMVRRAVEEKDSTVGDLLLPAALLLVLQKTFPCP
jgi:hypothetical protein